MLTVSIVSHRQAELVSQLLADITAHVRVPLKVVLTVNVPEPAVRKPPGAQFVLEVVDNSSPKGFGANHNAAFRRCDTPFFCILNPDVRLQDDPFPRLVATLQAGPDIGLVAPLIRDAAGRIEASSRRFPTPSIILRKALRGPPTTPDYAIGNGLVSPDWVGGMFMLVRSTAFSAVGGFDQRYFMYYEDVDLCARLRRAGCRIALDPGAQAVHEARHDSHRRPRYLAWHLRSMLRFWLSPAYRRRRESLESSKPQRKNVNTPG
jgi:N-acetylglucosaminyl-diphospho-decaprenol L-rhamnosyltransferase